MQKTKEDLIKEVAKLTEKLEARAASDLKTRTTLSELLGSYEWENEYYGNRKTRKVVVMDWLGIAFNIGELKSDAEYSLVLSVKEELKRENEDLRMTVKMLREEKEKNNINGNNKI